MHWDPMEWNILNTLEVLFKLFSETCSFQCVFILSYILTQVNNKYNIVDKYTHIGIKWDENKWSKGKMYDKLVYNKIEITILSL